MSILEGETVRTEQLSNISDFLLNCAKAKGQIDSYLDDDLDRLREKCLERHLESCESCRCKVDEHRFLVSCAKQLGSLPMPSGVSERLRARLGAEINSNRKLSRIK